MTQKKSYYRKVKERIPKIITFRAKTWAYICKAIEGLKSRYRRICRLISQTATGAGLFTGSIQVA